MDIDEILEQLKRLPKTERDKILKNLERVTFNFKVNSSFLNPKYQHPITIKKEVYDFMDIHGVSTKNDTAVIFPDGSSGSACIRSGKAGYGFYYQIRIRSGLSGISKLKLGDIVIVQISNKGGRIIINLSQN